MFMRDLTLIVHEIKLYSERSLKEYNLSFTDQLIIIFLSKNNHVNQDSLVREYCFDKGNLTKALNKLEGCGYITRTQNPDNKRENLIALTQQGQLLIDPVDHTLNQWHEILCDQISNDDVQALNRICSLLASNSMNLNKPITTTRIDME